MAPPRASFPARIHAPDFLGINWAKSCWRAPYNNLYPLSICAGQSSRMLSSPIYWGNKEHRATRNVVRNVVLLAPTIVLSGLFVLQADLYWLYFLSYGALGMQVPDAIEKAEKERQIMLSREKPGVTLKHKHGGQISIPGSGINITDP